MAVSDRLLEILALSLGTEFSRLKANILCEKWIRNDFSGLPQITIRDRKELAQADGAFAAINGRASIFLARDFVATHSRDPEIIAAVILEEIGHFLDAELNSSETPGDEGALFSALIRGVELDEAAVAALKAENDHAWAQIDGEMVLVECAGPGLAADLVGNLRLNVGLNAADRLIGDQIDGNEILTVYLVAGSLTVTGFGVSEVFTGITQITGAGGAGNDNLLVGDNVNLLAFLSGGDGDDQLRGGGADDLINGDAGHDVLEGRAGADTLLGGDGNDVLEGGAGADLLDGGIGIDAVSYASSGAAVSVNLITGMGSGGDAQGDTLLWIEQVKGSGFNDTIIGGTGAEALFGFDGDDFLKGGTGADWLSGGSGQDVIHGGGGNDLSGDTLDGGAGIDTLDYADSSAGVLVNLTLGSQFASTRALAGDGNKGAANLDVIAGFENIIGSLFDDSLVGSTEDNTIDVRKGFDTVEGGSGTDVLVFDWTTVPVTSGVTYASFNAALGSGVLYNYHSSFGNTASVNYSGFERFNFTGTNGGDALYGGNDPLGDTLIGGEGNDILRSLRGMDYLVGGPGIDQVLDADYSDALVGLNMDNRAGLIAMANGTRIEGVEKFVNLTTGAFDDIVRLTGAHNDSVTLGAGDDLIDVGEGFDTVTGGSGTDVLVFDWTAVPVTSGVTYSSFNTALGSGGLYTYHATLGNTAAISYSGFERFNLTGTTKRDDLRGGALSDTLNGGADNDSMAGGLGDDLYVVDSESDRITEEASEGTDTVESWVNFILPDNLENLTLLGTAINGTGNATANVLLGNMLPNRLVGGLGNDSFTGGAGNDTLEGNEGDDFYMIDNGDDVIVELDGEGYETVLAQVSYDLTSSPNVERLVLSGSAQIGIGNASVNSLIGNDLANTLDGAAGNDSMEGHAGDDVYFVDSIDDLVFELAGEGNDTVYSSGSYTLPVNVENLILSTGALTGKGNAANNLITGNDIGNAIGAGVGNDTLDGGGGIDTLAGGLGNDVYLVSETASFSALAATSRTATSRRDRFSTLATPPPVMDTVVELANAGTDRVETSANNYVLKVNLEDLTLIGAAIKGTGNSAPNRILGNSNNNLLIGGGGSDTLTGSSESTQAGEVDTLTGGTGADIFVLGTAAARFYSDGGASDYAYITDFVASSNPLKGDRLQLMGGASDYVLSASPIVGKPGTGVFFDLTGNGFDAADELVAIVKSAAPFTINESTTNFVA